MSDLVERLRLGSHEQESDLVMHEAADEIERLQSEKLAWLEASVEQQKRAQKAEAALADARRKAFIEAAKIVSTATIPEPASIEEVLVVQGALMFSKNVSATLRAKAAEETPPPKSEAPTWGWFMEDIGIIYGPDGTFWDIRTGENMSERLMAMEAEYLAKEGTQP